MRVARRVTRIAGLVIALASVTGLILIPRHATAQNRIAEEGRAIASARCGICHAVAGSGPSQNRRSPPFRTLHERYPIGMLEQAMRTGVISGHDQMPMFELTPGEIAALVTYLDSLSPAGRHYMKPAY